MGGSGVERDALISGILASIRDGFSWFLVTLRAFFLSLDGDW